MRNLIKFLTSRLVICFVLIAAQIYFIISWMYDLALLHALTPLVELFSFLLAVVVINREEDSSFKMIWLVLILAVPIVGIVLYLLCAGRKMPKRLANGTTSANSRMKYLLRQNSEVLSAAMQSEQAYPLFYHAFHSSGFPVYGNTASTYFKSGEEWYPVFLTRLREAKHFIFLEYFIINDGPLWEEVLSILKQKAQKGVEVKLIYDDMGSLSLPMRYTGTLAKMGIEAYAFNRLRPQLLIQMNNRDHRKICVIDNVCGFTGGVNLSDEYINTKKRHGYWRDSAIMIEGDAVWSLTVMFLGMYSYLKKNDQDIDYAKYRLACPAAGQNNGYYQPFSDTPTDAADLGFDMHRNMILHARRYVYIDTPYLILNDVMRSALCLAADNGVDVRIMTPHIPDKIVILAMTRGNYMELLKHGVRIFEFTPGFNHTKNFVMDDRFGIVGTVNMDYRSYYLHFENGVLFDDPSIAIQMRRAYEEGLAQAKEVTLEECRKTNVFIRMARGVANLFAPLC